MLGACLNTFARNDGNPGLSIVMTAVMTTANIFGDWLMVYPLKKGVAGAAIATGAANLLGFLVVLSHYILKKGRLRFRRFRPQLSLYRKIILRGAPEMISQFANPIITFSMNNMLITHLGNTAVNAYSVITYASSLFSSLIWGLASGLQPLYGASYGAKDDKSLRYYFRIGRIIAFVGGVTIFLMTFFVGGPLCLFFGYDFVWYTVTIAEGICFVIAIILRKVSEKNGIIYR